MDLLPISALQHLLYCERQCALIHIEQVWAENQFTAEGNVMHEKAHEGPDETKAGVRIVRGLPVRSETLGLSGQCDVVEFEFLKFKAQTTGAVSEISNYKSQITRVLPVEYKRGKPKAHRADEVQLCAQALCIEETLGVPITEGRLFYGQTRRRTDVVFDLELRELTREAIRRLHELIANRVTPLAVYEERKCEACSLKELCLPQAMRFQKGAGAWFQRQMADLQS
ncbi:CRISPR-associated protein Cas4 [soil metagenome]